MNKNEILEAACATLAEHYSHVQVLVSWNESGITKFSHTGRGNWYARQGMAQSFIKMDTAQENAHEMQRVLDERSE